MRRHIGILLTALAAGAGGLAAQQPPTLREWTVPWARTRPRDPYLDRQGRVWFVGQQGDYVGVLDPGTGEFRRYELALMRVMGGSRGTLFRMILLEGLILAVLGYLLGIVLSHVGMEILAGFMKNTYRYSFSGLRFLPEEVWLLGGALVVGFVAALIPALQARRTDISETLAKG